MDPLHEDLPYWLSLIDYLKIKAFIDLTMAETIRDGVHQLTRLCGIGAMKPNTVVLGFTDDTPATNTLEDSKLLKTLKFAKLDRSEVVEYFTGADFAPTRTSASAANGHDYRMDVHEYVSIIVDSLKLNKNICLARHFHKLDKDRIFG